MVVPLCWDVFCNILKPQSVPAWEASQRVAFALPKLADFHFLDHHAAKMAARSGKKTSLLLNEDPKTWERSRLEVCCLTQESSRFIQTQQVIPYTPGIVVQWLNATTPRAKMLVVWRDYQTSVDQRFRILAGDTIEGAWPHLRLGLITGVDLFHCGEFYAAHEDWESLWMRLEEGPERLVMQGLIQLCGAHIHRLKGRKNSSWTMWEKAKRNLESGRALEWIDSNSLIVSSERALSSPLETHIDWPVIPLINQYKDVPRKHR